MGRTYNKPGAKDLPLRAIPIRNNQHTINKDASHLTDGRMTCRVCDQPVSVNPNSLDVHAKTHLNFKQHQCGYCSYRSCMSAKVKRHLENVHRGLEGKQTSLSSLPPNVRAIVNEMRVLCFPQLENPDGTASPSMSSSTLMSASELDTAIANVRVRLIEALHVAGNDNCLDPDQRAAALNAAQSIDTAPSDTVIRPTNYDRSCSTPGIDVLPTQVSGSFSNLLNSNNNSRTASPSRMNTSTPMDEDMDDEDDEWSLDALATAPSGQKMTCELCRQDVQDSPSALGLHVRNHLNYRPFSCKLCEFKCCIQAKVKRHLLKKHRAASTEFEYNPEAQIRAKVTEMKLQCFPRMRAAIESAQQSNGVEMEDDFDEINGGLDAPMMALESSTPTMTNGAGTPTADVSTAAGLLSLLNAKLSAGMLNGVTATSTNGPSAPTPDRSQQLASTISCSQCGVAVENADQPKRDHACTHAHVWNCSDCGFAGLSEQEINEHADTEHGGAGQPIRLEDSYGADLLSEEQQERLVGQCFNADSQANDSNQHEGSCSMEDEQEDEEESMLLDSLEEEKAQNGKQDAPRYQCQLCGQAVSMYASSLYVHVKNHLDYKPYQCPHCGYKSPVKSKVRRHLANAHKDLSQEVGFHPKAGIEQDIMRMKKQCFPEVTAYTASSNSKTQCSMCKTDISDTPLSIQVHVKNHMDVKPFHCNLCNYRSCLRGETRRHITRQHPNTNNARVIYKPDEDVDKARLDQMVASCFGADRLKSAQATQAAASAAIASVVETIGGSNNNNSNNNNSNNSLASTSSMKLGQAFREWYCLYCDYSATSKYHVKEHCITQHPGLEVKVSGHKLVDSS